MKTLETLGFVDLGVWGSRKSPRPGPGARGPEGRNAAAKFLSRFVWGGARRMRVYECIHNNQEPKKHININFLKFLDFHKICKCLTCFYCFENYNFHIVYVYVLAAFPK